MENPQHILKRILRKKPQSSPLKVFQALQLKNTKERLSQGVSSAEHALHNLAEGGAGDLAPNPYLNARRSWNEHVGSLITAKQSWQFIALMCLLVALASLGGMIHIGSQSKFIPYIIEVDKFGQIRAEGALRGAAIADIRVIQATLVQFITDSRVITPDASLQKQMIYRLYSRLNTQDPATTKMNEWLNGKKESNPFERAKTEMVDIEVRTVVAQTKDTWQVEWVENTRDKKGKLLFPSQVWRALITVYTAEITKDTTDEQLRNNPLSLYVEDFNWSRVN